MTHLGPEAGRPLSVSEGAGAGTNGGRGLENICLMPVPAEASPPPTSIKLKDGLKADYEFPYRDESGKLLGHVLRWEARPGGKKEFRPLTYWRYANGKTGWLAQAWSTPRPLYGLDRLAAHQDAIVLLIEGEKAANAVEFGPLADAFKWDTTGVVGVTWPGGGKAIEYIDFAPLAGRDVIILPDDDRPGEKTADALVEVLRTLSLKRLRRWKAPPEVKQIKEDGWDIADAIPPGWTAEALVKSIVDAPDVSTAPPRTVMTLVEFLAQYEPPNYLIDGLLEFGYFTRLPVPPAPARLQSPC
jgi:hypothetical protein